MNGEYFAVMGGTGFDALMIEDAGDDELKERFGRVGYVQATIRATKMSPVKATAQVRDGGMRPQSRTHGSTSASPEICISRASSLSPSTCVLERGSNALRLLVGGCRHNSTRSSSPRTRPSGADASGGHWLSRSCSSSVVSSTCSGRVRQRVLPERIASLAIAFGLSVR